MKLFSLNSQENIFYDIVAAFVWLTGIKKLNIKFVSFKFKEINGKPATQLLIIQVQSKGLSDARIGTIKEICVSDSWGLD